MTMELDEFITERVALGFWTRDQVEQVALEAAVDRGHPDPTVVRERVGAAWSARWVEAERWPRPRQVERLAAVFEQLRDERVMTIDNAGYTSSDGMDAIDQVIEQVPYKLVGYVYYHEQDVARCLASSTLTLAFGAFRDTAVTASSGKTKAEMGAHVAELLRAAGFTVDWNGEPSTKLALTGFTWDRLPDDPPWGPRACIAALRARVPLG